MELVDKYADKIPGVSKEDILKKIPGYGEPGLFEDTIAALKDTVKYAGHEKISKKYPDESSGIVSVGEAILTLMGETNRFTYFLKDNHEVTGALKLCLVPPWSYAAYPKLHLVSVNCHFSFK